MKKIFFLASSSILFGCVSSNSEINSLSKQGYSEEDIVEILNKRNVTEAVVYSPEIGIQQDDSIFISDFNFRHVASLVSCQSPEGIIYQVVRDGQSKRVEPTRFTSMYESKSFIDSNNKVRIRVNRPNCEINYSAIEQYLTQAIKNNKEKNAERIRREIEFEETNPKNVFVVGCNAYLNFYKDISYLGVSDAVKKYPKLKEGYVKRLYLQGWNVAASGVANSQSACEYYSHTSFVVR